MSSSSFQWRCCFQSVSGTHSTSKYLILNIFECVKVKHKCVPKGNASTPAPIARCTDFQVTSLSTSRCLFRVWSFPRRYTALLCLQSQNLSIGGWRQLKTCYCTLRLRYFSQTAYVWLRSQVTRLLSFCWNCSASDGARKKPFEMHKCTKILKVFWNLLDEFFCDPQSRLRNLFDSKAANVS